jgi:hypothetical protein
VLTNKRSPTRGIAMLQGFQESVAQLEALLQQTRAARGQVSMRAARPRPVNTVRFQVQSKALSSYRVVDLETGVIRGAFSDWKEAMNVAQQLEATPILRLVQ